MVLPGAIDAKILPGKALAFETGSFQQPDRRDVGRNASGFDPVKLEGAACDRHDGSYGGRHMTLACIGRPHPIAEAACLCATPTTVGERQPTNENFIAQYPELTATVLESYERARQWILDNPDEAAQILAEEAKIPIEVAQRELVERTVLDMDPVPGETQTEVLRAVIPIFEAENQVKPGTDLEAVLSELLAPEIAAGVVAAGDPAA